MLQRDMKKTDIERMINDKGDFVQIDYLTKFIKLSPPIDMKKYAYLKLAGIHLRRRMYQDAAKMFRGAAINSLTFKEQKENYLREAKSYIKAQKFEDSQKALKKSFAEANLKERRELYDELVSFYKKEGEELLKKGLPGKATSLFEKLIRMKLTVEDKKHAKEKLLALYQKLGKTKDYDFLKTIEY